jgi:MYXO-CTERM domain-containing protein
MNPPNENVKPGGNVDGPKPKAGGCEAGCGCHTASKPGNKRWVIGVILLAAAGVLVARAVIEGNRATKAAAPDFALPTALLPAGIATNSGAVAPATEQGLQIIELFSDLNGLAAKPDAIFVYLPGKEATSATPPLKALQDAMAAIEHNGGQKCSLFTLKAGSADYDQIAGKISFPSVLVLAKGHGISPVTGEITEAKLVQGYMGASSAADCAGGSGCCPK